MDQLNMAAAACSAVLLHMDVWITLDSNGSSTRDL